jgi:ketosteroid isomerase-like protein
MTKQLDAAARRKRAHQAVDGLHAALLARDMMAFADLWAPGGRLEFPFAPPGWTAPQSREEVRDYLRPYTDWVDLRGIRHQTRHETADPDTLILEWGVDGVALATGRPYVVDYVAVITVGRDGIEIYRDYWNALAVGHALGRLPEMAAAFSRGETAA